MSEQTLLTSAKLIAGIDDATKCPVIGSIFLAGVIADEKTIEEWKKLGVKDSKLVAPKKREKLAKIIKETALGYSIEQITPQQIDDKSFNLNDWEMLTVLQIIKKLNKIGSAEEVYIDNWETSQKGFRTRLKSMLSETNRKKVAEKNFRFNRKQLRHINYIAEHYADENYTVVGAASILAKTSSDKQYRNYTKKYGNFGSGNPGDPTTRHFVWQHRHNPLPIIRTSWHTFKILSQLEDIDQDFLYGRKLKKLKTKQDNSNTEIEPPSF